MSLSMKAPAWHVRHLHVAKGGKSIVKDVSLHYSGAGLHMVLGPNGAGKSTLLRAMVGLEGDAAAACVSIADEALTQIPLAQRASIMAYAPAATITPFAYTASEVVLMGRFARHQGYPGQEDRRLAAHYLELMGLSALSHEAVTHLSSGELQRVAIARALAAETPCLFLDEPVAHLDLAQAFHLLSLLAAKARDGHMVVMTHHDLHTVENYAGHCTVLKDGQVLASGPTAEAFSPETVARAFNLRMTGSAKERVFHTLG